MVSCPLLRCHASKTARHLHAWASIVLSSREASTRLKNSHFVHRSTDTQRSYSHCCGGYFKNRDPRLRPTSHLWREVGIANAHIPFPTWHLRSGKWELKREFPFLKYPTQFKYRIHVQMRFIVPIEGEAISPLSWEGIWLSILIFQNGPHARWRCCFVCNIQRYFISLKLEDPIETRQLQIVLHYFVFYTSLVEVYSLFFAIGTSDS